MLENYKSSVFKSDLGWLVMRIVIGALALAVGYIAHSIWVCDKADDDFEKDGK